MGWIKNSLSAIRAMGSRPNEITTSKELDDWMRFGGAGTDAGVPVTISNAQGLAAVAASVRVLSNGVAQLPLTVLREVGNTKEPARDLTIYSLLHNGPNAWQTSYQWRKLLMRDLLYRGNAYSVKVPGSRGIQGLIRLHPDFVKPVQDPRTLEVTYEYRRPDGGLIIYRRDQIFHVWSDSDDGVVGLNPIQTYRQSIGDGLAIREHGSRFFSNGARLGVVLEMPPAAKMGAEAQKAMLADFDSRYAGTENAHKTALLPGGITARTVSLSMEDAQWIEARKTTARELYGIYGIPPHKAGDLADATFSNVQDENLDFVISSLTPYLVCWEQAINRDLLGGNLFAKFNVSALLRGDIKSRAEFYTKMVSMRAMNPNEVREKEDMNPYEGGDEFANPNIEQGNSGAGNDDQKTS